MTWATRPVAPRPSRLCCRFLPPEGTALPSGHTPANSLTPSYLGYMDALLGPGAAQGALSARDALTVFETVSNSGEVWPTGTTLLEQGDVEGGSRGTAQMAELFDKYMPQWINAGSYAWNPNGGYDFTPGNLIAGVGTGTLNDRFDSAFTNFMNEALFDPNEDGAYRQPLMGSLVGTFGDLASGKLGVGMDAEARGRLVGGIMGILDQGFDQYASEIRSDAETNKAWASFGIGLAFALVPDAGGPKIAKILLAQGVGQGQDVVTDTVNQLIDAGVKRDIAEAAAAAANRGDILAAFEQLGLSAEAKTNLAEYIDLQQGRPGQRRQDLGRAVPRHLRRWRHLSQRRLPLRRWRRVAAGAGARVRAAIAPRKAVGEVAAARLIPPLPARAGPSSGTPDLAMHIATR